MRFVSLIILGVVHGCSENEIFGTEEINDSEPDIKVEPLDIYYGEIELGATTSKTITISNIGDAALEIGAVILETTTESDTNPFTFPDLDGNPNTIDSPVSLTLRPEEEYSFEVIYTAATTADQGRATIISNDPDDQAIEVALGGGFVGPKLQIRPPAYDFEARLTECAATTTFELVNVGTETLEIYDVFLEDEDFQIVEFPTRSELEPGQLTLVEVQFYPSEARLYDDRLRVDSNDVTAANDGSDFATIFGTGDRGGFCDSLTLEFPVKYNIADVFFETDTTGSMQRVIGGLTNDFQDIAATLFEEIEDLTFGVGEFRDYNYVGMGNGSDKPFELLTQQTNALPRVQQAIETMVARGGADLPESSHEALYQVLTGQGYDQNCDGNFDSQDDVLPFKRRSSDAFGGTIQGTFSGAVEGTGTEGGVGFRRDVLPIVIFATDNFLRDPGNGYPGPGGCTTFGVEDTDATSEMVLRAKEDMNARIIGVSVNDTVNSNRYRQMDAVSDYVAIWASNGDDFKDIIVNAVLELVDDETFDLVELIVTKDDFRLVDSVTPDRWEDVPSDTTVSFTVETVEGSAIVLEPREGETTEITVEVYGTVGGRQYLIDAYDFNVLIPEEEEE